LGREDIADSVIRLGYSPFLTAFTNKNSMMAAIEASQVNIVKLIIGYEFTHSGVQRVDHKKNYTDDKGNNVLHFAYKRASA
jgi:hypothetical protein